jgi:hypothetical protein
MNLREKGKEKIKLALKTYIGIDEYSSTEKQSCIS